MNNDSLLDLSSKVQFRWYDNAENVLSPWGGSCFSGGVLLFPHYCLAVPEAVCQSCCAAACECWGVMEIRSRWISVLFWYTVEFLTFAFHSCSTLFFHGAVLLGSWEPKGQSLLPGTLTRFFSHFVFFTLESESILKYIMCIFPRVASVANG